MLDKLKSMEGQCRMLFLEASPETIIKRYKETRRRHPLSDGTMSLEAAVEKERELLAPVRERADFVIDTSKTSTAQLRMELLRIFEGKDEKGGLSVTVASFGFKYGLPLEADLIFDVRFMPNPFYIDELRHQTGLDDAVRDYVFSFSDGQLHEASGGPAGADAAAVRRGGQDRIVHRRGLHRGHHRSVAVAHALTEFIRSQGYSVQETHRDMSRES